MPFADGRRMVSTGDHLLGINQKRKIGTKFVFAREYKYLFDVEKGQHKNVLVWKGRRDQIQINLHKSVKMDIKL